ncbi:carbohydrate-binding protein [Bradyrhizobium sp. Pha-3]|uniref:carbohydrate-binding protein n=1 Tax=Bradyrhizobium sp. Pha-3 TaxID=208375 RepID=UPI0035D3E173
MPTPPTYAPITYSANDTVSGRWTGQGSVLTAQQGNYNFYNHNQRIAWLESNYTVTVSIATITSPTPGELLFTMTDSSTQGPIPIPAAAFHSRGAWAPFTSYNVNDTVTNNGTIYDVPTAHTSAATFDPGANDGHGNNYYSAMLTLPGNSLPSGGAPGMAVVKNSSTNFDYKLAYILPSTGSAGEVVIRTGTGPTDYVCGFVDAAHVTFTPSTASALVSTNVAAALEELKADIASGGGSITLSGLSDVNVTEGSGINGYYLSWNNATSKWVAVAAASNLSGLADVNVTEGSGINGWFLQWNQVTGKWIAAASSASLAGLSDVNVTEGAGIDGYSLKWNNATSKWIASTSALSGLSDVNVTEGSGIDGYFLKWSNSTGKWIASLTGATATLLSGLSDVNVTEGSGIDGYFLKWNNGTSKWIAGALGTAAAQNTGTSGATVPLLNGANTWASAQTFTTAPVFSDAPTTRSNLGVSVGSIEVVIDGGGSAIGTGLMGFVRLPFAGTITEVTMLADRSGSIVVDIWKCTYSQFDAGATHPVVGDSITASDHPTISSATKSDDTALTGWTTSFSAGDILGFNVNSASTVQRVTLALKYTK